MEIRSQPASFSRERTALLFDSRAREVELWMKTEKKTRDDFNVFNKNYSIAATSSPTLLFFFFAFLLQQKSQYLILISQRNSIRFIIIVVMRLGWVRPIHTSQQLSIKHIRQILVHEIRPENPACAKAESSPSSHSSISQKLHFFGWIYGKFPHIFDDTR